MKTRSLRSSTTTLLPSLKNGWGPSIGQRAKRAGRSSGVSSFLGRRGIDWIRGFLSREPLGRPRGRGMLAALDWKSDKRVFLLREPLGRPRGRFMGSEMEWDALDWRPGSGDAEAESEPDESEMRLGSMYMFGCAFL